MSGYNGRIVYSRSWAWRMEGMEGMAIEHITANINIAFFVRFIALKSFLVVYLYLPMPLVEIVGCRLS